MGDRVFALAVLGGGPAALVATLAAARQADVALVMDRLPREEFEQTLIEKLCFRNWLRVLERTWGGPDGRLS